MRPEPVPVSGELHLLGGEGAVFRADFRGVRETLLERYRASAGVVYLDPPFNTGGAFEFRKGKKQLAYSDLMPVEDHLEMMREAAVLSKELLREDGTFFLHVDWRMSARMRMLCDEVFGEDAFVNEIIWAYKSGGRPKRSFASKHDTILMYRMSPDSYFDIEAVGKPRGAKRRNHMKRSFDETGRVYYSIRTNGKEYRYYEDDPIYPSDVWDDIEHLHQRDPERTGFITQKPEALLKRIILSCSREGDTVIDLFGGSGTTASAAAKLKRSYVSVDMGAVAAAVTRKRLIARCLKLRLYDAPRPMTVEYDTPVFAAPELEKYFDIEETGDRLVLRLKRLGDDEKPYYAALGVVRDGVFSATEYVLDPVTGDELKLDRGKCMHLVDEEFNEFFVETRE